MTEMIERVARKLAEKHGYGEPDVVCEETGWAPWRFFEEEAREVIAVLRDAPEEVLEAGAASPYCMSDPDTIWRAMIDKAVGPAPSRGIPLSGEELPF